MATINITDITLYLGGSDFVAVAEGVLDDFTILNWTAGQVVLEGTNGDRVTFTGSNLLAPDGIVTGGRVSMLMGYTVETIANLADFSVPVSSILAAANDSVDAVIALFGPVTFNGHGGGDVFHLNTSGGGSLYGYGGDDTLRAGGSQSLLDGGTGNDTLVSGPANDILDGDIGNDTYVVNDPGDVVVEVVGGGNDKVIASVSYVLGSGVYVETLQTNAGGATTPINLTGNSSWQEIIGNYGPNVLHDGGAGAGDNLRGLSGNDTYRVFNSHTTITESAAQGAHDKVITAVDYRLGAGVHVETLQTNGGMGTADRDLTGNEIGQEIIGNNGDNRLEGKGGDDTLRGLGGDDSFVFADPLGPGNVDTIVDFDPADDRFLLSNNIFSGFGDRTGAILPGHLRVNTSGQAQDASDMIIYESDAGRVWYDADGFGAGARVLFAVIDPGLAVTNADFVLAWSPTVPPGRAGPGGTVGLRVPDDRASSRSPAPSK